MEILLGELDPKVWEQPGNSGRRPQGAGSLAKAPKNENRNLKEMLGGLKLTSSVTLVEQEKEGSGEESDQDESFNADRDKLLADSEALAKPRIPKAPVEKPRNSASLCISEVDRFLDPFCERTLATQEMEASTAASSLFLPVASSVICSPIDLEQSACVSCSFAPVPLQTV